MQQISGKKRIDWIDCAKGIGILLVIIGHSVVIDSAPIHKAIRGGIFSFHMPLFFILSAMTYRFSTNKVQFLEKQERAFKHLIVPMLWVYVIKSVLEFIKYRDSLQFKPYIIDRINALAYASGSIVKVYDAVIPALGTLWFIVVLFLGRLIYDYIHLRIQNKNLFAGVVAALTVAGVAISKLQWLPLSLDLCFACFFFFWFGDYCKKYTENLKAVSWGAVALIAWASSLLMTYKISHNYLELATRSYPLFPLCYFTAVSGTVAVMCISYLLVKTFKVRGLVWVGRHSMYLFFIHILDWLLVRLWTVSDSNVINTCCRLIADIVVCIVIVQIKAKLTKSKAQ